MKSRTARTGEAAPHGLSLQSKILARVATVAVRLSTQWQSGKQTPLPYVLLSKSKPNLVSAEIIEWNDNPSTASPGSSENSQMVVPREAAAQAMRNPRRELQCHRECHLTLSLAASKSLDSLQCSICVCFHLPRRCCRDQSGEPDSARPQQSNKLPKGKPKNETVPAVPVISCPRCLTCSSQGKAMHAGNSLGAPNKGKLDACASGPNWATGGALVSKKSGSLANWLGKNDSLYCALCGYMCMYCIDIQLGMWEKLAQKTLKCYIYSYTFFQMLFLIARTMLQTLSINLSKLCIIVCYKLTLL